MIFDNACNHKLCNCGKGNLPCGCDNCEYAKRFGGWTFSCDAVCMLCRKKFSQHTGWRCPEKKEWTLSSGIKIESLGSDAFKISSFTGKDAVIIVNVNIPSLIKILQEIGENNGT